MRCCGLLMWNDRTASAAPSLSDTQTQRAPSGLTKLALRASRRRARNLPFGIRTAIERPSVANPKKLLSKIDALLDRATALHNSQRLDEAAAVYQQVLKIAPREPNALNLLGLLRHQQGRFDEAASLLQRAVQAKPDFKEAWLHYGNLHQQLRNLEAAAQAFEKALEIDPNFSLALLNMGNCLRLADRLHEADIYYVRAIAADPTYSLAWANFGKLALDKDDWKRALKAADAAVDCPNPAPLAYSLWLDVHRLDKPTAELASCFERLLEHPAVSGELVAEGQFFAHHIYGLDPRLLLFARDRVKATIEATVEPSVAAGCPSPRPEPRTLGFLSAAFRRHPVAFMTLGVLEQLRDQGFRLCFYSGSKLEDEYTSRFRACADVWRDIHGMSDRDVVEAMRADGVDVLFDMSGITNNGRPRIAAMRAAPLQIKWVGGQCASSGIPNMDAFLTDAVESPAGCEADYHERLLRMPHGYVTYTPPSKAPEPATEVPVRRNGHVTFGSLNKLGKLSAELLQTWARILHAVPNSRLLFRCPGADQEGSQQRIIELFEAAGIGRERLLFEGPASHYEFLETYNRVDIALDSFPYTGGLTTCEALWMGVPVVALAGRFFAERHAATHLHNVGLGEWVASEPDEYVRIAVGLAQDHAALARYRAELRDRMARSPLCDHPRFAADLAKLVRAEWARRFFGKDTAPDEQAAAAAEIDPNAEPAPVECTEIFGMTSCLRVVDIGSNPIDGTPPYSVLLEAGAVRLIGFEPQREALAELNRIKGPHEVYYPYAVGDGAPATLYLCRASGMTSTLKPNFRLLNHFQGYPQWAEVMGTETIPTVRLDDLSKLGRIDWLKIDIQGGELRVFEHAERSLADTLVIQTEANFVPLYEDQPLFADIDSWMRRHGFMLHALLEQRVRLYAPLQIDNQIHQGLNQLTTADAVYVPDFERLPSLSADQLGKLAAILHAAYGSSDLAVRVLMIRDLRYGGDQAERFLVSLGFAREQADAELAEAKRSLQALLATAPARRPSVPPSDARSTRASAIRAERMPGRAIVAPLADFPLTALEAPAVADRVQANLRAAEQAVDEQKLDLALAHLERAWILNGPDQQLIGPLLHLLTTHDRWRDAADAAHAWAMRCHDDGDVEAFAEAVASYHSLIIQLNHRGVPRPMHEPTLVRAAEKLLAPLRQPVGEVRGGPGKRLRIAYVIPLECERNSTITALPLELSELHDSDRYEIEFFSLHSEREACEQNPPFKEIADRIRQGGWRLHEGKDGQGVLAAALDLAERIRSRDCDAVVFSIQIGVAWFAALLRPAPVVLGIDWGHPQWYSSTALDFVISPHRHFRMESVCEVLPWRGLGGGLRHGLDSVTRGDAAALGASPGAFVVVSSGSQAKYRDPRFWEVVNDVLAARLNCEWLIVGIDRAQVPQGCLNDDVAARVHFLGWRQDFVSCVTAGDLYVDTFPIGGGFALAPVIIAGIPCVTVRHNYDQIFNKAASYSSMGDILRDDVLTVEQDVQSIVGRVLELIDNPEIRAAQAKRQRECFQPYLKVDERVRELESLYEYAVRAKQ